MTAFKLVFVLSIVFAFNQVHDLPIVHFSSDMTEICDNGIDDDGDNLIDLNDDDCECVLIQPESLIPNPSFEDMNCCPSNRSQLSCSDVWIQASEPTTDYLHSCGWNGWEEFPAPMPYPDGEAIMGFRDGRINSNSMNDDPDELQMNWKEYAGACLSSPLLANDEYRFEFYLGFVDFQKSPQIDITFFGTTDCDYLPFGGGDAAFGCPTNGPNWVKLGSRRVGAIEAGTWMQVAIDVNPDEDIHAIAIGPPCARTLANQHTYYFFDQLVLADVRSFEFEISEINHPCSEDFTLSIPFENNRSYQWYKDGIALVGEGSNELSQMYGDGEYQTRILFEGSCELVEPYTYTRPILRETSNEIICENDVFNFGTELLDQSGVYIDTLKNQFNCDSISTLILDVRSPVFNTVNAKIFEGETYQIEQFTFDSEGEYDAMLFTEVGCDSIVHLDLEFYQLFFPSAFSPNGDGVNDIFMLKGATDLVEVTDLTVFDRWGNTMFAEENLDFDGGWDGIMNGESVSTGTYIYRARVVMDDGVSRTFKGSVAVMR